MENKLKKIESYLLKKGLKPHYKGFNYIVEAINFIITDKTLLKNITKRLYNMIAYIYDDNQRGVENAIHNCIKSSNYKMSNKQFIARTVIEFESDI